MMQSGLFCGYKSEAGVALQALALLLMSIFHCIGKTRRTMECKHKNIVHSGEFIIGILIYCIHGNNNDRNSGWHFSKNQKRFITA